MSIIKGSYANKLRDVMKLSSYLVIARVTSSSKGFMIRRFHLTASGLDGFAARVGDWFTPLMWMEKKTTSICMNNSSPEQCGWLLTGILEVRGRRTGWLRRGRNWSGQPATSLLGTFDMWICFVEIVLWFSMLFKFLSPEHCAICVGGMLCLLSV